MSYNFLRDARTIENSFLCVHDTLDSYSSDFHINGDVDSWDIYNNIYLYGCWNGILFGTANDRSCYISRNNVFPVVEAENYYYIQILMKVTNNNTNKAVQGLTTGRIQWLRIGETSWDSTKQIDFDLVADDKWRLYNINMGPAPEWQGNINNLRIYPFTDGWSGDHFAIKFIKISSLTKFACDNTQCSFFSSYAHNCLGAGVRGSCEAGTSSSFYTTVSGVNDELAVDIDGYGYEYFNLGDNENSTGIDIAKIIANKISMFNIGGYSYSSCEYSETDKLKITSGTVGTTSAVRITGSAAEALGFEDSDGDDISTKVTGTNPATGFDYASSRFLSAYEISKLIDGDTDNFAYIHDPTQYSVEGGRRDFNEVGTYILISDIAAGEYYESLNNVGKTIIDYSHPIDNNGKLKAVYMYGKIDTASKIKILRPRSDGQLSTVYSLSLPTESASYLYTSRPAVYRVDCDILVNKGDLIGIYNADLYVGVSKTGLPDATFCQITGEATGIFDPGIPFSYGLAGLSIYARGDRWQTNTILDIDLGDRVNIEEINIHGSEDASYFEFNIASCLDVSWEVDLFSGTHIHSGVNWWTGMGFTDTHTNQYYGRDALDDSIRTADNGQLGTSYGSDSDGLFTSGDDHSYFYVNGDAEWLYQYDCTGKTEYCGTFFPFGVKGYKYDPIAFTLKFPNEESAPMHKSIIYFKERNNFRGLALSYYLGQYEFSGNADDSKFRYIPSYNSVKLDGIEYLPGDNDYIFNNPMSARVRYASGDKDPINWEEYSAATGTDWTIIEHNFDEIEALGFRIYTNHHNSTKISEIELYSKMKTTPSLLDNVTLSFSDYGEIWVSPSFNEITSGKIQAFLGGAPRYITMEFDASTEFSINEIELLVGDQVKTGDCSDIVLLDHAKSGAVNEATPITLENIYDKPFDLTVDLPRQTYEVDNLVFWSKVGSYDEIEKPEIGPGCKLFKSDDYNIRNDNGQCAINTPCYGLKNMIDGKAAYYSYNDVDYVSSGTLSSGVSLDFCNTSYKNAKTTTLSFTGVSSPYWKVGITDASNLADIKDIIAYYDDTRVTITTVYSGSSLGINSQTNSAVSDGTAMTGITNQPYIYDNIAFGFAIGGSDPVNKIKLVHSNSTINIANIYTSPDNTNNYVEVASSGVVTIDPVNASTYTRFAVDLEKRHDLEIIRNYATGNLYFISTSVATDFSNDGVSNVDNVTWGNSTKDDVRWLRISLPNNGSTNCIRKLGIYPDIETVFSLDGGYNCEWQSLGNILSDYDPPINVAYDATVTGTNYYFLDYYPENAVDGVNNDYKAQACWGFQKVGTVDPYLEIDFGQTYLINKLILYHGYDPQDSGFMNTDYTFSGTTSASGSSFTAIFSQSSNTDHYKVHQFDPVYARRVRLTITGYDYERQVILDEDTGSYELFKGSYLREIEVYTYTDSGYVDSESWPIVATDLTDQFDVTDHSLINKDVTDTATDWDNSETFFRYSDNIFDDPQKVSFTRDGEYITYYQKTDSWLDAGATEYIFDTNVYFDVGTYIIEWAAYADADLFTTDYPEDSKISLRLEGPAIVDHFADVDAATTWLNESGTITVPEAGRYTVKGVQHIEPTYIWGARNPNIYRSTGLIKWVSARRDTATNYSYDDDSGKYGKDYLSTLKVFGDTKYNPTEYDWWWNSTVSTLSNDALIVKIGRRSLKIDYPASSVADTVSFIEGDDFGIDEYFNIKDVLHFWWYISDVSKLDSSFGDVTFGIMNSEDNAYYKWDISDMSLSTGWNDVRLKFEDASEFYPSADEFESIFGFVSSKLDFKNNSKDMSSLRFRFRGVGQAFTMNIDDLKIQRNVFEDDVKFDKGLCLTGHDYLEIPLAGITLERGTIEFWMKPYTDSGGRNLFTELNSRLLFSMVNNNNNIISLGIKSGAWLQPITGHIRKALSTFEIDVGDLPSNSFISINEVIHIAFVWSHDGEFTDNKDTIRLYINNELWVTSKTTWEVDDTKSAVIKLGGATAQTAHNSDTYGSAIFDNVKIYNYCKTEFNIETEGVEKDISYTANEFLEVSSDNITFYGMGSTNLPIVFQAVPAGTSKTIYVRPAKNDNFAQSPSTANILIEWLTTV